MEIKELLNKELSYEETNEFLNELMGYSCNIPSDSSEVFKVFDDMGDVCYFRKHIGIKPLNTFWGILHLKECIDYERGKRSGVSTFQNEFKKILGIY